MFQATCLQSNRRFLGSQQLLTRSVVVTTTSIFYFNHEVQQTANGVVIQIRQVTGATVTLMKDDCPHQPQRSTSASDDDTDLISCT